MDERFPNMELPLGFGFAMAQTPEARGRFAAPPEPEREALGNRARGARSKQEMRACVDALVE